MGWWQRARRRRRHAPSDSALTLRDEKILLTLVAQTQQLNDRLTRLEDRVEAEMHSPFAPADEQDLLDLRLHSAKLAAELSRVTIELRAEINELAKLRNEPAGDDRGDDDGGDGDEGPAIDLRGPQPPTELLPPTQPPARHGTGWRPARPAEPPTER